MKKLTTTLVLILALSLPMSAFASAEATPSTFDEQLFKNVGKAVVQDFVLERESEYYDVLGIDFTDSNIVYTPDKVSFKTHAAISNVLKATDAEELPYVKGYLSVLGIDSYKGLSATQKTEAVANTLEFSKTNTFDYENNDVLINGTVNAIDQKINDVQSYIGNTTKMGMDFVVFINTTDLNNINQDNIKISALDSLGNEVNVNELNLQSYETMYQSGVNDLNSTINELQQNMNKVNAASVPIGNWGPYNRIAAQQYSYTYWGHTDSDLGYNLAYTNYNPPVGGGDCANFVSQCIYAGGVPTSTYWKADSTYWISASNLTTYMVNNGYATQESYTNTNAGNFAYTAEGHIVLVTINNTVDICYTAHNYNRLDAPFTQSALSGGYTFYVIKNY